jgi:hypothetical protein
MSYLSSSAFPLIHNFFCNEQGSHGGRAPNPNCILARCHGLVCSYAFDATAAWSVHAGHKQHQQSTSHRAVVLRSASTASRASRNLEGSSAPPLIRTGRLLRPLRLQRPSTAEEARASPLVPLRRLPSSPSRRCATRKCGSTPPSPAQIDSHGSKYLDEAGLGGEKLMSSRV